MRLPIEIINSGPRLDSTGIEIVRGKVYTTRTDRLERVGTTEWADCTHCKHPFEAPVNAGGSVQNRCPECMDVKYANRNVLVRKKRLAAAQGGKCPCGDFLPENLSRAHLDHDHKCCDMSASESCGLCDRWVMHGGCNIGIAHMMESPRRLRNLADALEGWQRSVVGEVQ